MIGVALHEGGASVPTVASWTRRGRNTILDEPRPVEVLHDDGQWYRADLTATRHEPDAGWWGFARYVVGVGRMHWQWKHQSELRRAPAPSSDAPEKGG